MLLMINITIKTLVFQQYFFFAFHLPTPWTWNLCDWIKQVYIKYCHFVLENKKVVADVHRYLFWYFAITLEVHCREGKYLSQKRILKEHLKYLKLPKN